MKSFYIKGEYIKRRSGNSR